MKRLARAAVPVVLLVTLSACGSGGSSGTSGTSGTKGGSGSTVTATTGADGVQTVTLDGNDELRFVPSTVKARVGKLRLTLKTVGNTPHDFLADNIPGGRIGTVNAGDSQSTTMTLGSPGTYRFVCTFHEQAGMVGKLVVSAS